MRILLGPLGVLLLLVVTPPTVAAQSAITFQFDTTIDATPAGGPPEAPIRATFSFDPNLAPGSGQFMSTPSAESYGPITMTLQVGSESVSASGPGNVIGIGVFDNAGTTFLEDGYGVQSSQGSTYVGQLFGYDVEMIDIHIIDSDLDMFGGTALPLTPEFASRADQTYVQILLIDAFGNGVFLSNFGENRPFSLTIPTAVPTCGSTVDSIPGLRGEVNSLHAGAGAKRSLNEILAEIQAALDAGVNDDARNGVGKFIRSVIRRSTREEDQNGRLRLDEANHLVCSAANVLLGVPGQ
jgi:hypothetical protein